VGILASVANPGHIRQLPKEGSQAKGSRGAMALQGPIPVEFGDVFPDGAYAAGKIEMVRDYERSTGDRAVQQVDKATGLPLWVVEVIDADEAARQRTVKVKIAAQVQPVLPSPAPGSPFTAVEFDGLTVTPYVDSSRCQGNGNGNGKGKDKCGARLAYSLKAAGVRAPSRGVTRPVPAPEHKDAA
jgi:hypothetical protein